MEVAHPSLEVMRRMFAEGFAIGNDTIVDELCSPDLVEHQFGLAAAGAEAIAHVKAAIRDVHVAVPDRWVGGRNASFPAWWTVRSRAARSGSSGARRAPG